MFQVNIQEKIATVQFNRPDKANALHKAGWESLKHTFEQLDANPAVRAIILSSTGKHFCAGIDLELFMSFGQLNDMKCEGRKRESLLQIIKDLQTAVNTIENCRKPVIAAIQGGCIGGGLDIVAACDLRFCTGDAYFTIREIDMGMVADLGTLQRLPKLIPYGKVAEMAYSGRKVFSGEAERIGLVNQIFPDQKVMLTHVHQLAQVIAKKSPLAIRGTKESLRFARDHSVQEGLQQIQLWNAAMLFSDDLMIAMQAKMMKQAPNFED